MGFPDSCIRGIPNPSCLLRDGNCVVANATLFPFPGERVRLDGWIEESVNWMDDEDAVAFTLSQAKEDGEHQFKIGVAVVPRIELDKIGKKYGTERFTYDRSPTEVNRYHGNLLLKDIGGRPFKRMICAVLAHNSEIILREDHQMGIGEV